MPKLYKAIDRPTGNLSAFIVRDDGFVAIHVWSDAIKEVEIAKSGKIKDEEYYLPSYFNDDAINPILIAEW